MPHKNGKGRLQAEKKISLNQRYLTNFLSLFLIKQFFLLALVAYEIIIANLVLRASLAIYHFLLLLKTGSLYSV